METKARFFRGSCGFRGSWFVWVDDLKSATTPHHTTNQSRSPASWSALTEMFGTSTDLVLKLGEVVSCVTQGDSETFKQCAKNLSAELEKYGIQSRFVQMAKLEAGPETGGFVQLSLPGNPLDLKIELVDEDPVVQEEASESQRDDFLNRLVSLQKLLPSTPQTPLSK